MISVERLFKDVSQTLKSGTSGYFSEDDFNKNLEGIQTSLLSLLAPYYGDNRSVRDMIMCFSDTHSASAPSGVLSKPDNYFRITEMLVGGYPVHFIAPNEIGMLMFQPSRIPDVSQNRRYYFEDKDNFNLLPSVTASVVMHYLRHPDAASISLTAVSDDDSDYISVTAVDDLEWPDSAYNLIYFSMLQRLGISQRENLIIEFSTIGIQAESSKISSI